MATSIIGRYADVRIDLAFKKCFGTEQHKAATIGKNGYFAPQQRGSLTSRPDRIKARSSPSRKACRKMLCGRCRYCFLAK